MNGFRAACKVQARKALDAQSEWWSHYAPKGKGRVAARAGFLVLAPGVTMFVWFFQGFIWLAVGVPILSYALVMALIGGGIAPKTHTGPPLPPAVASADGTMRTPDGRWISFDGGNNYVSAATAAAMAPPPPPPAPA